MSDVVPKDLQAERSVLGAILVEPEQLPALRAMQLTEGDFSLLPHGLIWRACCALADAATPIDLMTLRVALEKAGHLDIVGGLLYLSGLPDGVPKASNARAYAGIVREKARARAAVRIVDRARHEIATSGVTADVLTALAGVATMADARPAARRISLTAASAIAIAPVRHLWSGRAALASLGLLAGREGVGKTAIAYTLAAGVTRGTLPGACLGRPAAVIVVAGEDSWSHTVVPRLMAAGADLDLVFRVDVTTSTGGGDSLILPLDLAALQARILDVGAVLVLLDPLLSRLDAALDSHKDADVRLALEPLAALADATGACLIGLIHLNKSTSTDPLSMLMASRAFAAVARWVLFAMTDPTDDTRRLLGLVKNNLGPCDVPTLTYRVVGHLVGQSGPGEDVWTGKLEWLGESATGIRDAVVATTQDGDRTATGEAAEWLGDYLASAGGSADSAEVKRAGAKAGHSIDAIKRARQRIGCPTLSVGFPRRTVWSLPAAQSVHARAGSPPTAPTAPTGDISSDSSLSQSVQSAQTGRPRARVLPLAGGPNEVPRGQGPAEERSSHVL